MNKLNVAPALIAGLLGGLLTRYIAPPVAFAQDQTPAAREIRAQSFTLVDTSDRAVGTFTAEPIPGGRIIKMSPHTPNPLNGPVAPQVITPQMRIVLRDSSGREIWSAGGGARILPALTESSR